MTSQDANLSLYSLTEELSTLMDEIAGTGGELSEDLEASHEKVMALISAKTDGVCGWVSSQDHLIALADLKIKEIQEFKKKIQGRTDRFKGYVNACLMNLGVDKLEGTLHVIKKRKPAKVARVVDEETFKAWVGAIDYIVTPPPPESRLDVTKLGKDLKSGLEIPGAALIDSDTITISYGLK